MNSKNISEKNYLVTLFLCSFLGFFGAHRIYINQGGHALGMFMTAGGFGIWVLIDLINISREKFEDSDGKIIKFKNQSRYKNLIKALIILACVISMILLVVYADSI